MSDKAFEETVQKMVDDLWEEIQLAGDITDDISGVIDDPSKYSASISSHVWMCAGYLRGAAEALNMTVREFLDEYLDDGGRRG